MKVERRSNGLAVAAMVLGIIAFVIGWTGVPGIIVGLVGLILGIIALVKKQGKGFALTGVILSALALVTGLIVSVFAVAVLNQAAKNSMATSSSNNGSSSQQQAAQTFKVGDVIDFDGKQVTVNSADRNWDSGNDYIKPNSGNEFVKVNVTIKNNSSDKISYNTFDWKMEDSNGKIQDVASVTYSVDGALNSGELAPGGTVSGFLVFEVPSGDSGLKLSYNPSFFSDRNVTINL